MESTEVSHIPPVSTYARTAFPFPTSPTIVARLLQLRDLTETRSSPKARAQGHSSVLHSGGLENGNPTEVTLS